MFQNAAEKLPFFIPNWTAMYVVNAFVVVWVLVVGFGFGGWASMTNFVKQVDTFGLFAKCYQCPPKVPASNNTMLHHWKLYMFFCFKHIGTHQHLHPCVFPLSFCLISLAINIVNADVPLCRKATLLYFAFESFWLIISMHYSYSICREWCLAIGI